jgi:hypothetical protein
MDQRVVRRALGIWFSVACALAVAAGCSSQKTTPPSDGGTHVDAQADSGPGADATQPSACSSCEVTTHALTRGAPPDGTCTFTIGQVPPNPENVRVLAGLVALPQSDVDGWVYLPGMTSIELTGSCCDSIRDAGSPTLIMLFGCPSCPIP